MKSKLRMKMQPRYHVSSVYRVEDTHVTEATHYSFLTRSLGTVDSEEVVGPPEDPVSVSDCRFVAHLHSVDTGSSSGCGDQR